MLYSSLYIHSPFCAAKCDYCAFYSFAGAGRDIRKRYLSAMEKNLERWKDHFGPLDTLFIGGGTPTHFTASELEQLMAMIQRFFQYSNCCEFTVEGNPCSITEDKIRVLQNGGVNRFSIGVQSFSETTRSVIGRHGDVRSVERAIGFLKDLGVENFNVDLIYGVPQQTVAQWETDLQKVTAFEPAHVSTYSLIVEPGTPLADRGVPEGDDEILVEMWNLAEDILSESCGMRRYEVSNFSRKGQACRHNLDIWKGGKFAGAGPAACYFDGDSRWTNPPDLERWIADEPPTEDYIGPKDRAIEILATGLRTVEGWNSGEFRKTTGFDFMELRGPVLTELQKNGVLEIDSEQIRLTQRGLLLADYVERELL